MAGLQKLFECQEPLIRLPTRSRSPKLIQSIINANNSRSKLLGSDSKALHDSQLSFCGDLHETPRFYLLSELDKIQDPVPTHERRAPFFLKRHQTLGANQKASNAHLISTFKDSQKLISFKGLRDEGSLYPPKHKVKKPVAQGPSASFSIPDEAEKAMFKRSLCLLKKTSKSKLSFIPLIKKQDKASSSKDIDTNNLATSSNHFSAALKGLRRNLSGFDLRRSNAILRNSSCSSMTQAGRPLNLAAQVDACVQLVLSLEIGLTHK